MNVLLNSAEHIVKLDHTAHAVFFEPKIVKEGVAVRCPLIREDENRYSVTS